MGFQALSRQIRHALRRRDGATALEFGLIGTIFCMLLLGGIEVGRYYYTYEAIRTIVAEAARQAQVNPSLSGCAIGTAINSTVTARSSLNVAGLQVCFDRTLTTNNSVSVVVVNATYNFAFVVPFFTNATRPMTETTRTVY